MIWVNRRRPNGRECGPSWGRDAERKTFRRQPTRRSMGGTGVPILSTGTGLMAGQRSADHSGPGAAMLDEKLFVVTETGNLWERHWRSDLERGGRGSITADRQSEDHPGPWRGDAR